MPTTEEEWMTECIWLSARSPDPFIKMGAILVNNKQDDLLFRGWNQLPKKDSYQQPKHLIDWKNPNRGLYMIHAELVALDRFPKYTGHEKPILYVSGFPCAEAIKQASYKNVEKIIWGPGPTYAEQRDRQLAQLYDKKELIKIVEFTGNLNCMRDKLQIMQDSFPDTFRNPKEL